MCDYAIAPDKESHSTVFDDACYHLSKVNIATRRRHTDEDSDAMRIGSGWAPFLFQRKRKYESNRLYRNIRISPNCPVGKIHPESLSDGFRLGSRRGGPRFAVPFEVPSRRDTQQRHRPPTPTATATSETYNRSRPPRRRSPPRVDHRNAHRDADGHAQRVSRSHRDADGHHNE